MDTAACTMASDMGLEQLDRAVAGGTCHEAVADRVRAGVRKCAPDPR